MIIAQANRLNQTTEYYFSSKLKELQKLRARGTEVINLGIGSPDLQPEKIVIDELSNIAFQPNAHGYQSYQGVESLRKSIGDYLNSYYSVNFNFKNEILPLMGSKEGIMHISLAFLNPGDKVLIPNPGYPTYQAVTNLLEAETIQYDLSAKEDWDIDIQQIKNLPLDDVKLMWLNYPNMPTGGLPKIETLRQLIKLAHKHKFLIVNDNPYSQLYSKVPFSIFQIEGTKEVALELQSISKSHNMAGWRLGWVFGISQYIDTIIKIKSNMDSGMFLPIQKAAEKALTLPSSYYANLRLVYQKRRQVANQIFDALGCSYSTNQEGMFVWGKISEDIPSVEKWVDEILNLSGVFITPGFIFGSNGKRYLRISLCASQKLLQHALEKIKNLK